MKKSLALIKSKLSEIRPKFGKKFDILLALLLGVIVIVIFASSLSSNNKKQKEIQVDTEESAASFVSNTEYRLQNILSSIKGAGKVKVFVSTSQSSRFIYLTEGDSKSTIDGSNKTSTTSSTVVFSKDGTYLEPILEFEIYPEIEGVLIVAEGATDEKTKLTILNAASVALNLEISKIEVLAAEKS